jgi:protein phosphatase
MYIIIGDVHGCYTELVKLLIATGCKEDGDIFAPPENKQIIFTGDIIDKGPENKKCFYLVKEMVEKNYAILVMGNHDDKLMRWAKGNNVKINHGLEMTAPQFEEKEKGTIFNFLKDQPKYYYDGSLVVAHAYWDDFILNIKKERDIKGHCFYGPTTGRRLENGLPERIDWPSRRKVNKKSPIICYGHYPYKDVRVINQTYGLDTGCVFGNKLSALIYPEMDVIDVKAEKIYYENNNPF